MPASLITTVLKDLFGMSYRKILHTAYLANSDRSLVLRQKFAMMILPLLAQGKRIINFDESSVPFLDFRHHKWGVRTEKNSISRKDLTQRVNMIAAVDTEGKVYAALTQVNTNSEVMVSFLSRLATVLKNEDPQWMKNTILLCDGAKYHKSPESRRIFKQLGASYIISSPYSYDAAPVEHYFSYFKRAQVNPEHLSTGKT